MSIEVYVKTPPVPDADGEGLVQPKLVLKVRGFHTREAAIEAARDALEEQRDWIHRVLDETDDDWEVGVNGKGDISQVRIVGKGLVAFPPDQDAPTVYDGGANEGDENAA